MQAETNQLSNLSYSCYQTHCFFLQIVLLNCAKTGSLLDTGAHLALQWDLSFSEQLEQMVTLKSYFATG